MRLCADAQHGIPPVFAAVLATTMLPNGTGTLFNQAGTMTVAPYGSTTAWNFLGWSRLPLTATAVPYKAAQKCGSSCSSGGRSGAAAANSSIAAANIGSGGISVSHITSFNASASASIKQSSGSIMQFSLESSGLTVTAFILALL